MLPATSPITPRLNLSSLTGSSGQATFPSIRLRGLRMLASIMGVKRPSDDTTGNHGNIIVWLEKKQSYIPNEIMNLINHDLDMPLTKKPTIMFNPLKTVWFCWDLSPSILGTNLQWVNHSYLQIEGVFAQEDDQLPPPPPTKRKKRRRYMIYIYTSIKKSLRKTT